jgi:hypothetical protein
LDIEKYQITFAKSKEATLGTHASGVLMCEARARLPQSPLAATDSAVLLCEHPVFSVSLYSSTQIALLPRST